MVVGVVDLLVWGMVMGSREGEGLREIIVMIDGSQLPLLVVFAIDHLRVRIHALGWFWYTSGW